MPSRPRRTRRLPSSSVDVPYPPHEAAQTAMQGLHPSAARAQRQHQGPPLQRQRTAERLPFTPMDEARGLSTAAGLARVRTRLTCFASRSRFDTFCHCRYTWQIARLCRTVLASNPGRPCHPRARLLDTLVQP